MDELEHDRNIMKGLKLWKFSSWSQFNQYYEPDKTFFSDQCRTHISLLIPCQLIIQVSEYHMLIDQLL